MKRVTIVGKGSREDQYIGIGENGQIGLVGEVHKDMIQRGVMEISNGKLERGVVTITSGEASDYSKPNRLTILGKDAKGNYVITVHTEGYYRTSRVTLGVIEGLQKQGFTLTNASLMYRLGELVGVRSKRGELPKLNKEDVTLLIR